jgi:hypothetical protein
MQEFLFSALAGIGKADVGSVLQGISTSLYAIIAHDYTINVAFLVLCPRGFLEQPHTKMSKNHIIYRPIWNIIVGKMKNILSYRRHSSARQARAFGSPYGRFAPFGLRFPAANIMTNCREQR